ncbi:Cysteine synthase [Acorus gramineus]|uniref:Cysteine synthase n=1 Tax=Acorus gramineus TaxID=55184 RepID=A0AAV9ALF0_ACOGR|nr:Cysteine synthase [Acorus gramineus]
MAMEGRRGLPSLLASSSVEANEDFSREHIASSVTQLIGWTPLIELKRIVEKEELDVRLVGKMIEDAEEKGLITPGVTTLVEPTSGNLGIALAYIAALKDPMVGYEGIFDRVNEIKASIPNAYFLDQTSNPANPEAHFLMTGPEIWKDTAGKVDIFVCCSGTGGTISGTGKYLKTKNPAVKVICVEPAESPLISGGSPGKHDIQGIGPPMIPINLDKSVIDEVITITTEEAMSHARRLAKEEGLLIGISSGAALAACLKANGADICETVRSFEQKDTDLVNGNNWMVTLERDWFLTSRLSFLTVLERDWFSAKRNSLSCLVREESRESSRD